MQKDMSEGSPYKLLIFFMIPIVFGNLFQQFYSMVDTIIIGQFSGVQALAAIGAVGGLFFFVVGFANGLGNGFAVIIAQEFGKKNYYSMKNAFFLSIVLSVIISIIISAIFYFFSYPLLRLLNTPEDIIHLSNDYIATIYLGLISFSLFNLFSSVLRAVGDSKSPLIFLMISSILNIIFDLIFVIKYGCFGVAFATVLAQVIATVLIYMYISKKYKILKIEKNNLVKDNYLIKRLLNIGLPGAIQFSVCSIGVIIVQVFINSYGSEIVAAYSIGAKIENLFAQIFPAIGIAVSTYAAQNLGSGKINRIPKGFKASVVIVLIYSIIAIFLNSLLAKPMANLFVDVNSSSLVINSALDYTTLAVFFFFPLGLIFVFRTGCQGLGSGSIPMISSILEVAARIIAAFMLPSILGITGIYLANPFAWLLAGFVLPLLYVKLMKRIKFNFKEF